MLPYDLLYLFFFFFFNDTATTEIYTLSLHDALPISVLVYAGWGVALGGLILALAVSRARITPPQGGAAVSAWPGLAIAIAAAGLLLAATPLIETAGRTLSGTGEPGAGRVSRRLRPGWRLLVTVPSLAVAVSAPALAAGYWL